MIASAAEMPIDFEDRRDSLVGKIAAEIGQEIVEGRLAPGAELNSVDLAARFGSSRTPVREALMLLEKEGLVEIPPRRRPRVARIDPNEIEDLYAIREALNDLMIRNFIDHAGGAEFARMNFICAAMTEAARATDIGRFMDRRIELFLFWEDHCGNASLRKLLRSMKIRLSARRLVEKLEEGIGQLMNDNLRLAAACEARDAELAGALIRSMTRYWRDHVMAEVRHLAAAE